LKKIFVLKAYKELGKKTQNSLLWCFTAHKYITL